MKNKYSIKPVLSSECYEWFLKKHYARRLPNINCAFGLYDNLNLLQGVCSFGKPMSHTLVSGAINGLYQNNFLELNNLSNLKRFFISKKPTIPKFKKQKFKTSLFLNNKNLKSGGLRKENLFKTSYKNYPLISIIIPNLNGKFLDKTIDSVLKQKYPNIIKRNSNWED